MNLLHDIDSYEQFVEYHQSKGLIQRMAEKSGASYLSLRGEEHARDMLSNKTSMEITELEAIVFINAVKGTDKTSLMQSYDLSKEEIDSSVQGLIKKQDV